MVRLNTAQYLRVSAEGVWN